MKKLLILFSLLFLPSIISAECIQNVAVVDGPHGWVRDHKTITTQNCDDEVVIPGLARLGNMSSVGTFSHKGNVLFNLSSIENVTINGTAPTRKITDGVLDINQIAGVPNTRALNIDTNASGQPNTNSLVINYTADGMQLGEVGTPININLIAGTSSGGRLDAVSCTKVGNGGLDAHCFHVNPGIDVVHQVSGEMVFADIAFKFDDSGSTFTNVTTAFKSISNNVRLFEENSDIVYIGHVNEFSNIAFNLATSASGAGIKPVVEYSDGVGGWITLSNLSDATNGLKNSGSMSWIPGSLAGWTVDTINGVADKFWVRIIRTQNNLGTVPTERFVDIVEGVNYLWTEDGDLVLRDAKFRNVSTEDFTATGSVAFTNESGLAGTDFVTLDGAGNLSVAEVIGGGNYLQTVFVDYTTSATGTALIALDDSYPQSNEGDEYMTASITHSDNSQLIISVIGILSHTSGGNLAMALFQDAGADAINTSIQPSDSVTRPTAVTMRHVIPDAGAAATKIFTVRAGNGIAGTMTFNGSGGSRIFNTSAGSGIMIQEVSN